MDSAILEIDTTSGFGKYKLDIRQKIAASLARKTKSKPVINFLRQVGGLRSCKIADIEVYGGQMRVYPGQNRSDKIMLGMPHVFDAKERQLLAQFLRAAETPSFIDIGANIGAYSLFANGLNVNTKIVAIEADPDMFARLNFNMPDNVIKLNVAVADKEGILPFYINEHNRGENSLVASEGKKIEVPAKTLKQLLDAQGIAKPTAMKIDVEGMESVILTSYFNETAPENYASNLLVEHIHNGETCALIESKGYKLVLKTKMNAVYSL